MPSGPRERKELLLRIIDLCQAVSKRGADPFDVEVKEFFKRLRELLPKLRDREEFYLDMEAVLGLADVIFHQGEWIKHKSSLLYFDPMLILWKLHSLSPRELAEVFVGAWHPTVELECITPHGLKEAMEYWTSLPPLGERGEELGGLKPALDRVPPEELAKLGILTEQEFSQALKQLYQSLKQAAGKRGEVPYWSFVGAQTFEETVRRAWLVSFLVSYGYATLELKPLEEEVILRPLPEPKGVERGEVSSIPIAIPKDEWLRRVKGGGGRA